MKELSYIWFPVLESPNDSQGIEFMADRFFDCSSGVRDLPEYSCHRRVCGERLKGRTKAVDGLDKDEPDQVLRSRWFEVPVLTAREFAISA